MIKRTQNADGSVVLTISKESLPMTIFVENESVLLAHRLTEDGFTHGAINRSFAQRVLESSPS